MYISFERHDTDLLFKSLENDGMQETLDLLQEECAELIQAISKYRRFTDEKAFNSVVHETVDVMILLKKAELIFDYLGKMETFDKILREKIDRVKRLVDERKRNTKSDNFFS